MPHINEIGLGSAVVVKVDREGALCMVQDGLGLVLWAEVTQPCPLLVVEDVSGLSIDPL